MKYIKNIIIKEIKIKLAAGLEPAANPKPAF